MNFYEKMGIVCRAIPKGKVATYGQIALLCGKPRNSRQVGRGLKLNLAGEVPAFRVVNAKGELSGAGYFETYDMQKLLLESEGVRVDRIDDKWMVDLKLFGWNHTFQDALEFEKLFEEIEG